MNLQLPASVDQEDSPDGENGRQRSVTILKIEVSQMFKKMPAIEIAVL